jgi:phosphoglycolate phosphatase
MRAVILDFDGTVADSFSTVIKIAYKLTKRPQLADINQVEVMRANNVGLKEAITSLDIPKWQWPWLLYRGKKIMAKNIHQIPIFNGMDEVLRSLKEQKYALYIISSNSTTNVERFMLEKGLLAYFTKVYGGAALFNKAKLINKVLHEEKLDPDTVVYVGDEVRDILAAKQVGMPCIAVGWGYNSADLLAHNAPMVVARNPKELLRIITEWGNTL